MERVPNAVAFAGVYPEVNDAIPHLGLSADGAL